MKRFLLIFAVLGLVACDTYLPDETSSVTVPGTVVSVSVENFNAGGAVAGAFIGHMLSDSGVAGPLLGGAIGSSAAAHGCEIGVRYANGYAEVLSGTRAQCQLFKTGDPIQVSEVTRISYVERNHVKIEVGRNKYHQL